MLAKIGDFLKPASSARDPEQKTQGDGKKRHSQGQDTPANSAEDVVLLSIAAIRALVQEEASLSAMAPDLLRKLALLEQHGLQNLPVMPGQPVAEAITSSASFFSSSR